MNVGFKPKAAKNNGLMVLIDSTVTEQKTKQNLLTEFLGFFETTQVWKEKATALKITDASQVQEMAEAGEARKMLQKVRINTEKARKRLKEESLRTGQSIDAIATLIKNEIIPIEKHLEEQEKFIEIQEGKRIQELSDSRAEVLLKYELDPNYYDLGTMPDNVFNTLCLTAKQAQQDKIKEYERLALAEAQRLTEEVKEREKIRLENERLKAEAEERERAYRAEKEAEREAQKKEAERLAEEAAQAEQMQELAADGFISDLLDNGFRESTKNTFTNGGFSITRERLKAFSYEEFNERLKEINNLIAEKAAAAKAKESAEKLEAEKNARIAEEARKAKEAAAAKAKALAAPDRHKLLELANQILAFEMPKCSTPEAAKAVTDAKGLLLKTAAFIKQKAANL